MVDMWSRVYGSSEEIERKVEQKLTVRGERGNVDGGDILRSRISGIYEQYLKCLGVVMRSWPFGCGCDEGFVVAGIGTVPFVE